MALENKMKEVKDIEFCNENNMVIMNMWSQQPLHILYTWKSPGDISRNQIDYIMINQRFKNCVKQARTYPGADINSDHNPSYHQV